MLTSAASRPGNGLTNEDYAVVGEGVAVVLDGVSQWYTPQSGCAHGTRWFVRQLGRRTLRLAAVSQRAPLSAALAAAIEEVAAEHQDTCDLDHPWSPAAAVAVLRKATDTVEYLVLGDCAILLDFGDDVEVIIDDRLAQLDRRARAADADPELVRHLHEGFAGQRNRAGGYWIAAGDPAAANHALAGSAALDMVQTAGMLTDGAWILAGTYGVAWSDMMAMLSSAGPERVLDEVRRRERSDSFMQRWPRPKRHDDATAVLCQLDRQTP